MILGNPSSLFQLKSGHPRWPATPTPENAEPRGGRVRICIWTPQVEAKVLKLLIWCILFVMCWPLALAALVLYPIIWVLLLPFRIVGIAVGGVLALVWTLVVLPVRIVERIV
jgi:hypothetical protein